VSGGKQRLDDVVNIRKVSDLLAVTENLELLAIDRESDQPGHERVSAIAHELTRPVGVSEAKRRHVQTVEPSVEQVIGLGSDLVNSVNVNWPQWVVLIDRQVFWSTILLPRCREHDLRAWRILAARFQEPQLSMTIHHQVRVRIAHAVDVADLPSQVEDKFAASQQPSHCLVISHVGDVHGDPPLEVFQVEPVRAGVRH
jgi:hypothetical protein